MAQNQQDIIVKEFVVIDCNTVLLPITGSNDCACISNVDCNIYSPRHGLMLLRFKLDSMNVTKKLQFMVGQWNRHSTCN